MGNVTSTLTLRLSDDLSGPIAKAARELKGFTLSAQELDRAVKLDALRRAQSEFRAASTTFQAAQANVKKLAAEMAASAAPTQQMTRALEAARAEAARTGRALEQQSAAFRQARTAAAELGIPLASVAAEEDRLRARVQAASDAIRQQTAAMRAQHEQAQRLASAGPWGARPRTPSTGSVPIVPLQQAAEEPARPSLGRRILGATGNVIGTIAPFLGPSVLHKTGQAVHAGAELESERVKLRAAGIPADDVAKADALAMHEAARFPNVSRKDILERYKEARSVLLHPDEAMSMLPAIAQTNAALKALETTGRVEHGSTMGLGFALKGAEVMGLAQQPERLRGYLDAFVKAKQVMGELITPEQIYDFATNVKGSGALLSDRFIHTTAMSLTGELRGMRAGTGIDQFVKQITGGFQGSQHAAAKEFVRLGLIRPEDVDYSKTGSVKGLKEGKHVEGWRLAQTDPDLWVKRYLMPAMQRKGITDEQEQLALVKKMFTSSRAADIVSKLITQAPSYENHAKLMNDALGLAATEIFKDDPLVQLNALTTAFSTFAATLTSPVMTAAAHAMNAIAQRVAGFAEYYDRFSKDHPALAKQLAIGAIGGGAAGGAALTYGLIKSLTSGFGLKTSAGLLDKAAIDLSAAALALKGGAAAGAAGSAAGKVAAAEGAAAGAAAKGTAGKSIAKALATGVAHALIIGGVLYDIDDAVYAALPDEVKKEIDKRTAKINAVKPPEKTSKSELLRREFNKERELLGLPQIDAAGKSAPLKLGEPIVPAWTPSAGWRNGFGLFGGAGTAGPLSKTAAALSGGIVPSTTFPTDAPWLNKPNPLHNFSDRGGVGFGETMPLPRVRPDREIPDGPYVPRSVPLERILTAPEDAARLTLPRAGNEPADVPRIKPPPIAGGETEARSAGQSFGAAFTHGVVEELDKAIAAAAKTRDTIINLLTFGASPDLRAVTGPAGAGASAGGDYGSTLRGMHSDFGIAPP